MHQDLKQQMNWTEIARAIADKTRDDYKRKVVPTITKGRNRLGAALESLGRSLKDDRK